MSPVTVVFLDKNRIQFYESRDATLASLEVPVNVMKDLEIVDPLALANSVKAFLSHHRITASLVVIVLADSVFMSVELIGAKEEKEQQFQQFLATVPFEDVRSRRFVVEEKEIAIVVPRQGFEPLVSIFEGERFPVVAVIPSLVLGPVKKKRWLDAEMGKFVAEWVTTLVSESIMPVGKVPVLTAPMGTELFRGVNRLVIFVAIFIVLVLILFFLITGRV